MSGEGRSVCVFTRMRMCTEYTHLIVSSSDTHTGTHIHTAWVPHQSLAGVSNLQPVGHMRPSTKSYIYLKPFFFAHQFSSVFVYLMCGPRQLSSRCGPETPTGWTSLELKSLEVGEVRENGKSNHKRGEGRESEAPDAWPAPPRGCRTHSSFHFHTSWRKSSRLSSCLLTPRSFHSCFSTIAYQIRAQRNSESGHFSGEISFTQEKETVANDILG